MAPGWRGTQTPAGLCESWPGYSDGVGGDADARFVASARFALGNEVEAGAGGPGALGSTGHARTHGRRGAHDPGGAKCGRADPEARAGRAAREPVPPRRPGGSVGSGVVREGPRCGGSSLEGRGLQVGGELSRAQELHILAGHTWSDGLASALRHAVASTRRGIGPARHSAPLPLEDVARLDWGDQSMVPGGPCVVGRLVIAGAFFCMREIEISLARRHHVTLNSERRTSKCNSEALGKSRTWGCVCAPVLRAPCP